MNNQKVMIINGSPKPNKSTSLQIGNFLVEEFRLNNMQAEVVNLSSTLKQHDLTEIFLNKFEISSTIIFVSPLYIDSFPCDVIRAMELIRERFAVSTCKKNIIAIVQNGLEAKHNEVAIQILECFCLQLGYNFLHGFMIGNAGIINGEELLKLNRLTKNIQLSLKLTAEAVVNDKPIPVNAKKLMAKSIIPWPSLLLFRLIGNWAMNNSFKLKSFDKGIDKAHKLFAPIFK